eukprot:7918114-Ditylum_brightwellii.AAC.1
MSSTWNIQGVGNCKANRMGVVSDELQFDKYAEQGEYICPVDDFLCMIIAKLKDRKTFQNVSTIMESVKAGITWYVGQVAITVGCPKDVVMH